MNINKLGEYNNHQSPAWKFVETDGLPVVPEGTDKTFWICYRSKHDKKLRVRDAIWFNCPEGYCAPEDCELSTEDGENYWPVGWHSTHSHPEYSSFFMAFNDGEVLAYADFLLPSVPAELLNIGDANE